MPFSTDMIEMSNVPPPRSNTAITRRPSRSGEAVGQRRRGGLVEDALTSRPAICPASRGGLALGVVEVRRHRDDRAVTGSPSAASAIARSRRSTCDAISCGERLTLPMRTQASPLAAATMRYGAVRAASATSSALTLRPTRRLVPNTVWAALVTACRRAGVPTITSPPAAGQATTDGMVRSPSGDARTRTVPRSSMTATHELVVPRSMPMIREAHGYSFLPIRRDRRPRRSLVAMRRISASSRAARSLVGSISSTASKRCAASRRSRWARALQALGQLDAGARGAIAGVLASVDLEHRQGLVVAAGVEEPIGRAVVELAVLGQRRRRDLHRPALGVWAAASDAGAGSAVVARDEAITGGGGEPTGTRGGRRRWRGLGPRGRPAAGSTARAQVGTFDHRPRAGGLQRLGPRRLIAQPAVGVADQDEDLGGQPAQLLRGVAGEAIGVVALGQPGEGAADLGVAGLVADAEHLERVQLAQRLELGGERRQEFVLGGGQVLALVDGGPRPSPGSRRSAWPPRPARSRSATARSRGWC
jgi:hypothetical protein